MVLVRTRRGDGRTGFDAMTDPLQLALVGLGRMGTVHAKALAGVPEIDVVAVADPSTDARFLGSRVVSDRYSLPNLPTFELTVSKPRLLATPTPLHPAQVRRDRVRSARAVREAARWTRRRRWSCTTPRWSRPSPAARILASVSPPWRAAKMR
jgi:hypothetical protein